MIINKVKYEDIFKKLENTYLLSEDATCLICKKLFKRKEDYYTDLYDSIEYNANHNPRVRFCCRCVESPKHAEEVAIPLLKILFGGVVIVKRTYKYNSLTKVFKY